MIVKRTRAAAGLATAFALIAVTAPGGPAALVSTSEPVDAVIPPADDSAQSDPFATGGIGYEPSERVSVEVPAVAGGDLAAASRTVVSRMQDLEAGDISDRALGSYVFAAQAMQKADPDCEVTWSLLAAIGRIESGHGTKDGAKLRTSGKADPAIRGAALDGRGALPRVKDTDEGRFDEDRRWDRAVGPMQLLPSTWSYVGVDGDGNGKRNPDDLDDAALAVGVYLCAAADQAADEAGTDERGAKADRDERDAADEGMQTALEWFNPAPAYRALANRLEAEYVEAYGVTPYSAAPGATSLQAISLIAPMAPTLSPDRAVIAARVATATDARDDAADGAGQGGPGKGTGPEGTPGSSDGADPRPGSGDGTDTGVEPGTDTGVVPGDETDGDTGVVPGTDTGTDTDTGGETGVDTGVDTGVVPDDGTDGETGTGTDPGAGTDTDGEETPDPVNTLEGVLEVSEDGLTFTVDGVEIIGFTPEQLTPYLDMPVVVTYDPLGIAFQ